MIVELIHPSCEVVNTNTYTTAQGSKVRSKGDSVISYEPLCRLRAILVDARRYVILSKFPSTIK